MTEHESPIEVAFDISRIYKERLADVASFQFRNRVDERFHLVVNLRSRIFSRAIEVDFRLGPAEVRTHRFTLELPSRETCPRGQGSSGRHPIQIAISISDDEAPTRDRHSFSGEWMTMVLERDASHLNIVNHINVKIEQHGDKAGWGAINEINMPQGNVPKTPESNNELLQRLSQLPATFEPVPLSYEGVVDASSGAMPRLQPRRVTTASMDRCGFSEPRSKSKILALTGRTLTLGKRRKDVNLTTWNLPRSPSNDERTKRISGIQCRLEMTREGICIEQRSATNPTRLGEKDVKDRIPLDLQGISHLQLPGGFKLELIPQHLPAAFMQHATVWRRLGSSAFQEACRWSERTHIGGVLIRRTDAFRTLEEYLWVLSAVRLPRCRGETLPLLLTAIDGLHLSVVGADSGVAVQDNTSKVTLGENIAWPLAAGDEVTWDDAGLTIGEWKQVGLESD